MSSRRITKTKIIKAAFYVKTQFPTQLVRHSEVNEGDKETQTIKTPIKGFYNETEVENDQISDCRQL